MSIREHKKVLLIGPYPPPFGGIASHLEYFVEELKRHGYKTTIISNNRKQELIIKNDLKILRVNFKKNLYRLLNVKNALVNLRCLIMLKKYNLSAREILRHTILVNIIKGVLAREDTKLMSFYELVTSYSIPVLRKILDVKIPIVLTIYAELHQKTSFFRSRSELIKSMLNMSDRIVASSKYSARGVKLLGLDSSQIDPVYYGVDLNRFSPQINKYKIRNELGLNLNDKILLFVGRMNKEMGLDAILGIAPEMLSRRNDLVLLIVGAGGEFTKQAFDLQARYKSRVYVKVNIPFDDLPYYYAACDILLAPTVAIHASMGMSIKEAMASGKPVIATNGPGIAEAVVDRQTGMLVPADENSRINRKAFYETVISLLDNPEILGDMGTNARKRAEELFNKDMTSKRMIEIFEYLLEDREAQA